MQPVFQEGELFYSSNNVLLGELRLFYYTQHALVCPRRFLMFEKVIGTVQDEVLTIFVSLRTVVAGQGSDRQTHLIVLFKVFLVYNTVLNTFFIGKITQTSNFILYLRHFIIPAKIYMVSYSYNLSWLLQLFSNGIGNLLVTEKAKTVHH